MIELPEAICLAEQIKQELTGKTIQAVTANHSPHRFAWYFGDPADYHQRLQGLTIRSAVAHGGLVLIIADDLRLLLGDGVTLRLFLPEAKRPEKHQLLVEFTDGTALVASVQMYGGMWAFHPDEYHNPYYQVACQKPSPLSDEFDQEYFAQLADDNVRRKSVKAFLATEQRIPGLGNGVLQDILWNAGIHPRRPVESLSDREWFVLFAAVKSTLREMTDQGGRDTERDLYGNPGGYATRLSKRTLNYPCLNCGGAIKKEAYMGGSIYYCAGCQK